MSSQNQGSIQPLAIFLTVCSIFLVFPAYIMHRKTFRIFRHLQLIYLYFLMESEGNRSGLGDIFGKYLNGSWLYFDAGILSDEKTDYVLRTNFLFSVIIITLVFLTLLLLGSRFQKLGLESLNWQFIVRSFKAIMRIIYLPLLNWSIAYMNKAENPGFPTFIYIVLSLYPMLESLSFRFLDMSKLDQKMRFPELFDFLLLEICVALLNLRILYDTIAPLIIYGILWLGYIVLFTYQANFAYPMIGRLVYIAGEVLMLIVYIIYAARSEILGDHRIDAGLATVVFFLDVAYFGLETRFYWVNDGYKIDNSNKSENNSDEKPEEPTTAAKILEQNADVQSSDKIKVEDLTKRKERDELVFEIVQDGESREINGNSSGVINLDANRQRTATRNGTGKSNLNRPSVGSKSKIAA